MAPSQFQPSLIQIMRSFIQRCILFRAGRALGVLKSRDVGSIIKVGGRRIEGHLGRASGIETGHSAWGGKHLMKRDSIPKSKIC